MLGTATKLPPLVCSLLIDALDVVCGAVLATAGATPQESRALLAAMWHQDGDPGRKHEAEVAGAAYPGTARASGARRYGRTRPHPPER
jgi:hypothetical protein